MIQLILGTIHCSSRDQEKAAAEIATYYKAKQRN